jgi:type I restriction enzyme S subunit
MSEWRERELGELVAAAGGYMRTGPFGSQLHAHEYTDDPFGIPVVMPKDMVHGRVDRRSVSRVDHQTAERLKAHRLAAGDVVLARRGDVGRFAAVADDEVGWICGTGSMRVHAPDHEVLCSGFLRHAMSHPDVGKWLAGQAVGATMPNLNAEIVSRLPLPVPLVATQRRIAALLSAFDELIEINERRIELLEELAQSLYREWFVRFRFPGHENVEFVDSELGPIPKGWGVKPSSHVFVVNPRIPLPGGERSKVAMADLHERFSHVLPSAIATRASGPKFARDDVLLARITPCLENGKTALVKFLGSDDVGIGSTEFIVLRGANVGPAFTYCTARSDRLREHAIKSMSGASGRQRVASDCFDSLALGEPTTAVAALFEEHVGPMFEQVFALRVEMEHLAATHDLLLSRVVTGRLDISDIDLGDLLPADAA